MEVIKEGQEEMENTPPEEVTRLFGATTLPQVVKFFKEADAVGLNCQDFCVLMVKVYGSSFCKEEFIEIHTKIATNFHRTVTLDELLSYLYDQKISSQRVAQKNYLFPKPFKNIPVDCPKKIIQLIFRPLEDEKSSVYHSEISVDEDRPYRKGQYLSITTNGEVTFWTESFDEKSSTDLCRLQSKDPSSRFKRMCVNDMLYIRQLRQLAISTSEEELLFYNCSSYAELLQLNHALIVKETVSTMNYWSNDRKAVFSFGDISGYLSVFISYHVKENSLFYKESYEKIALQSYPVVYHSVLLKNPSKDFLYIKLPIFQDMCSQVRYFTKIDSFAICGRSCKAMVLATLSTPPKTKVSQTVFKTNRKNEFFTCVEYSYSADALVTGGQDGLLRVWCPQTTMCKKELKGHLAPITHIMFNPYNTVFISLSKDKSVRVWSHNAWLCLQSFQVDNMGLDPISSVVYNIDNNELVVANTDIAKCIGRGTDVFKVMLTSHEKPLCNVLYHSNFKQVVSAGQNGVVTVWDIFTGKPFLEFKVTMSKHVGLSAISFDGQQCSLVTITQDGKLRLWNFNSGSEIAVLPVSVPKEVTAIVCINYRLFLSGKHSKIIQDLDMKEAEHRHLEHDYLHDIASMDRYKTKLVTASSYGNIVIWDSNTASALYTLSANAIPQIHMAGKGSQGHAEIMAEKKSHKKARGHWRKSKHYKGVTGILCLNTRVVSVNSASLLISTEGHIYAWSVTSNGGPLEKFRAVDDEGVVITTMSTSANEEILLTGDSSGMISLWNIKEFGLKGGRDIRLFEDLNQECVSLCPPPLLTSWQAHRSKVVSVRSDPDCKNIITAGLDCNVKIWANTGYYIGCFGRDTWDATGLSPLESDEQKPAESPAPSEITTTEPTPAAAKFHEPKPPPPNYDNMNTRIGMILMPMTAEKLMSKCKKELQFGISQAMRKEKKKN